MSTSPKRPKKYVALIRVLGLVLVCGLALFGAFGFSPVCKRCGAIRNTTEWQIPLTSITVFRTSSERDTPVSAQLLRSGAVAKHEHQWLFSSGAGNGVMCALGEGRYIRSVVQSDGVAAILDASQRSGEIQFRDRLILLMFDPKTSEAVRVLGFSVPTNGFTNVTGFRAWLGDKTESFEDKIKVYQKR